VAWSYDLLDDAEMTVLERCSVFAGGFDLQSACAVVGPDDPDDYAILDLLDALVRKSLLVADRSTGRTRFFDAGDDPPVRRGATRRGGEATEVRTAHARYFAGRETGIMALWDSPRQREAYDWFAAELANLRTAFRWAADHGDLDVAAAIATYAGHLGVCVENYEPDAWAEELIEVARAVDHPRLVFQYVTASLCYHVGRIEEAVQFSDAGQTAMRHTICGTWMRFRSMTRTTWSPVTAPWRIESDLQQSS
jgi:predicted ATPase